MRVINTYSKMCGESDHIIDIGMEMIYLIIFEIYNVFTR